MQLLPPEELQQLEELEKAFIPRETKTPFLKRKIRQFESEAEPLQLKKPLCRLERWGARRHSPGPARVCSSALPAVT